MYLFKKACGGELNSANGSFTSPGFPNAGYSPSTECLWKIQASRGNVVLYIQNNN